MNKRQSKENFIPGKIFQRISSFNITIFCLMLSHVAIISFLTIIIRDENIELSHGSVINKMVSMGKKRSFLIKTVVICPLLFMVTAFIKTIFVLTSFARMGLHP